MTLLAIPNVSEGRDQAAIDAIAYAFDGRLLDVHSDTDHHRSVFTLAGEPGELAQVVANGAAEAIRQVDINAHEGIHPRVGAIDVAPIVYLDPADRGAACAEALVLGDLLGDELALPVFLYGELAQGRTRAELRKGGPEALAKRIEAGELRPDFGPHKLHPTAGAVLVAARPPLSPSTSSWRRRRRSMTRGRSRPRFGRAAPRACTQSARSGCGSRRATWPRCRPTSRTTGRRRSRASSQRSPATRRPARRSWSVLRHGRRSTDSRAIWRSRTAD